jgi:hypothetical protein
VALQPQASAGRRNSLVQESSCRYCLCWSDRLLQKAAQAFFKILAVHKPGLRFYGSAICVLELRAIHPWTTPPKFAFQQAARRPFLFASYLWVMSLTSCATILMTLDGNHLRLPNALVFSSVTINYTRNPTRRFQFEVGIGVNENLVRAQRIGVTELSQLDGVIAKPPPRAFINELGDSHVQMRFQGWVDQRSHDYLQVRSEAIRCVKLALEAAGMDMPEPIYRVQLTEPVQVPPASEPQREVVARADAQLGPVDTRAHSDLLSQVEQDRQTRQSPDLLDLAAPRE